MIRPLLIVLLLTLGNPLATYADEVDTWTLRDAARRALELNYGVRQARASIAAADAATRIAQAPLRPQLALAAAAYYNEPDAVFPFSDDVTVSVLPRDDWDVRIVLRQNLWAGGRLHAEVDQARLRADGARDVLRGTSEQMLAHIVTNFLIALRAQSLVEIETQALELAEDRLRRAEDLFIVGEVTQVDILRAQAAIKGAQRRLVEAHRLLDGSLSLLRVDLALQRGQELRLQPPQPPILPDLPPVEELLAWAAEHRPALLSAEKELAQAKIAGDVARARRKPSIHLEGTFTRQKRNFPSDTIGSLALGVRVPLFTGGAAAAEIDLSRERERAAALAVEQLHLALGEEIHRALLDLDAAQAKLELSEEQLVLVEAEHEQVGDLYDALELTSLDLSEAELALTVARRTVLSSRIDVTLAETAVWLAAGRLEEALLQEAVP